MVVRFFLRSEARGPRVIGFAGQVFALFFVYCSSNLFLLFFPVHLKVIFLFVSCYRTECSLPYNHRTLPKRQSRQLFLVDRHTVHCTAPLRV